MPYVHANQVRLFYDELGAGEPLVLVHGGWSDHRNWAAVAPALAESFRVVAYDRRGHSLSERVPGSRRDQEDDLAVLIEALGLAPAHVAGTSFGASIALGLAARRPELVRSLVAHEPPLVSLVADDPELVALVQPVQATIRAVVERVARGDLAGAARQFVEEVALGPGAWQQLPGSIRETMIRNAPAVVDETKDGAWPDIERAAAAQLTMPVLLSQGDQSPAWFAGIVAELARVVGHAQARTYAGASHAPHLTHPGDYVAAVTAFVAASTPAATQEVPSHA